MFCCLCALDYTFVDCCIKCYSMMMCVCGIALMDLILSVVDDHVCWYRTIMIEKILWQYIFTFLFWCSCIEMTIWLMCCWSLWYKFLSNYVLWCNDYFFILIKLLFLFLLCIGVFMFGWWCYWCRWYFVMGFLTTSFK